MEQLDIKSQDLPELKKGPWRAFQRSLSGQNRSMNGCIKSRRTAFRR